MGERAGRAGRRRLWPARLTGWFLLRFFAFVEHLGNAPYALSLERGECRQLSKFSWSGNVRQQPLLVEHPKHKGRNLAQALKYSGWEASVKECAKAREALAVSLSCDPCAVAQIFQEVSKPCSLEEHGAANGSTGAQAATEGRCESSPRHEKRRRVTKADVKELPKSS
eukprot:gnl/TRDRNA2_/TRDRNA2_144933_c1_seq1.p1 gnl/TRDRNA2_/TRDRNA2_144933_c1~~gnl/TRDRNA2_/TRDRNA2_144933_c1_seq1.p1  ORF type:complete len:168 (-),score=17.64 gnl/TRDRNA2_/TRDRNA2_144933_c1_seq1:94-597(-)